MIECQDILALCDRFEAYLPPLDIHVLRQRYNGQAFKSTGTVGKDMGLSDETVRTIENRALDALAHCLALEQAGQAITPMRLARTFKQPVASLICRGLWRSASCATPTSHRGEVLIYAPVKPMDICEYEMHLYEKRFETKLMTAYPLGAM